MNGPSPEMIDLFLQEASEHLQFLREYSGILQDPYPLYEDIERLYISAHGVAGTGGTYGYSLFNEVASKLAHIFQYAMNATISPEATAPLVEFIYEAIAVLESDLIMISANSAESVEDIAAFKQRYPFAFQGQPPADANAPVEQPHAPYPNEASESQTSEAPQYAPPAPSPAAQAPAATTARVATPVARPSAPAKPADPVTARPAAPRRPAPPAPSVSTPAARPVNAPAKTPAAPAVASPELKAKAPLKPKDGLNGPPAAVAPAAKAVRPPMPVRPVVPATVPEFSLETTVDAPVATAATALVAQEKPVAPAKPPIAKPAAVAVRAEPVAAPVTTSGAASVAAPIVALQAGPIAGSIATSIATPITTPSAAPAVAKNPVDGVPELEPDAELPDEVLEFFVPEVEEHLQTITDCLLALEARPNAEDINRLFRSMHTIKGSAAQVGWQRISTIAHRAEDLIGQLRDGALKPSATIIDLCLETVDVLKRMIYRQWPDEAGFQLAARTLLARLNQISPAEPEEPLAEEGASTELSSAAAENPLTTRDLAGSDATEAAPLESVSGPGPLDVALAAEPLDAVNPLDLAGVAAPEVEILSEEVISKTAQPLDAAFAAPEVAPVAAPVVANVPQSPLAALVAEADASEMPVMTTAPVGAPVGIAQSKSVRIALDRLDRMMNAVGELVINRTRMLGRLAELEKLAEVLNFSKGRMGEKVTEFQDKYEFSRINSSPTMATGAWEGQPMQAYPSFGSPLAAYGGGSGSGRDGGGGQGFGGGYSGPGYGVPGFGGSFDASSSEFSELEMDRYDDFGILSRSLTEISADITEVLTQLDGFVRRVDGDIDEFTKLAHRLQDEITQARMVPIGNLFTRIARTVRDAAKASNKQVELTLAGAETELDNNIIQQIADPLLHLVRNAVAHGIERAEERYEGGKPDQGNIAVRAYHRGNHIYVEVEDDGRGVDFERVRAAAVENGVMSAEDAEKLERRALLDLLFRPGFSTSPRRTELAGRGVGLDVVRANVNNLNGEIEIETEKGIGCRFTLKVPLTLIISQALFVQCGEQTFAFPLGFVEEIRRIRVNEIEDVGGKLITKVRDVLTEVVRLDEALQLPRLEPVNGYLRLVLVNVGGRQVGVVVQEVLRKDEIVIKNMGEYLRNVKLFPGATIAPDGSLILLVDINRLIMGESIERRPLTTAMNAARLFLPGATAVARGEIPAAAVDRVEKEKLVVLADDSISVRKFVGRMLEKAGYRIKLACDGLEALEIATSNACDLVITDLEMPRTNGYELMLHLRQTPSTSKVPVMVVTSRAGAKHRDRAMKEGAAAFMVKPVQEESFIAQVVELIGTSGQVIPASTVQ